MPLLCETCKSRGRKTEIDGTRFVALGMCVECVQGNSPEDRKGRAHVAHNAAKHKSRRRKHRILAGIHPEVIAEWVALFDRIETSSEPVIVEVHGSWHSQDELIRRWAVRLHKTIGISRKSGDNTKLYLTKEVVKNGRAPRVLNSLSLTCKLF